MEAVKAIQAIFERPQPHIGHDGLTKVVTSILQNVPEEHHEDLKDTLKNFQKVNCRGRRTNTNSEIDNLFNIKRFHHDNNIGSFLNALKGFEITAEERKEISALSRSEFTPIHKSNDELYKEQVEVLNSLKFTEVAENLRFHNIGGHTPTNIYLQKKLLSKVSSEVFFDYYRLRIPLQPLVSNVDNVASYQTISAAGKQFAAGFSVKGTAHFIPDKETVFDSRDVIICEGYATGESIYQGSGIPVVCAMSKSNILLAAVALTENETFELTIAADNDAVEDCRKVISIVNTRRGCACLPAGIIVPDNELEKGDFNDDWVANGGAL